MDKYFTAISGLAMIALSMPVAADPVSDFYSGKSLTMLIGSDAGGGYDLVGRMAAQHLGRHISGNPMLIPRNMPGASSVRAAEWFANVAPTDGTVIGIFQPTIVTNRLVDRTAKYQPEKYLWLGRISTAPQFGLVRSDVDVKTVDDAKAREVIFAANSSTGTGATVPWALNRLIGTKFRVVRGYTSAAAVGLAVERGEAQGLGSTSWEYLETKPDWIRDSKVSFLYSIALVRDPKIPEVPAIVELGKTEEDHNVLKLLGVAATLGRSLAVPPGTPDGRVAALRSAFDAMMRDPAFIADAQKRKIDLDGASGTEIQDAVRDIVAVPTSVVARFNAVTQPMD